MFTTTRTRPSKEAVLPSDPKWVVIEASDGDPRRLPTNTIKNPDAEGNVNFMQPVSINDGAAIKWRIAIGQALAEMLGYPDLETRRWVLKDWPDGYAFYDHNKGQLPDKVRHDLYLVGSNTVARFRSPQEFIPHAYWLMTNSGKDRSRCECKYCARKPQREISDAMGLSQRHAGSSPARFTELPRNKERRRHALPMREGRVFANVRQAPKPIKLPKGPRQHVNPEREKDLRAILGPKTLGERRWAREGELVWVRLDYPVPVDDHDDDSEKIQFWPGIIEEVNFKAEAVPKRVDDVAIRSGSSKAGSSRNLTGEDLDPWTIVHKSVYKIKLLVVSKTVIYGSGYILPYQSHAPDGNLLNEVQSVVFDLGGDTEELDRMVLPSDEPRVEHAEQALFKRFQAFDPFPPTSPCLPQLEERQHYCEIAAGAFATAIQIASRLSMYWTPCDAWEYKMHAPFDSMEVWDTMQNGFSSAEQQTFRQRVLGAQPTINGAITTQIRFQGLWWGPERIWMGDLVRLKLARYQFAPEGTEIIKKPSGAGKRDLLEAEKEPSISQSASALDNSVTKVSDVSLLNGKTLDIDGADVEMKDGNSTDSHALGAGPRSLFLRIDGLFVAQVAAEDEQRLENECRMCGMLYELADDDREPEGEEFGSPVRPTVNGSKPIQDPSGITVATPLTAVIPNREASSLANVINGSTFLPASPSGLFAPNPDLLAEPSVQADATIADGTQMDQVIQNVPSAPPLTSQPPSTMPINGQASVQMKPAESVTPRTEKTTPANPCLSGPLKSAESVYPTPPPPFSLKFRPILKDGYEVVMPLTTLAGRYYPGLLSNSLLQDQVRSALENPGERESKAIRALEGLVPGAYNSVDASHFLPRRSQMMREAENVAWRELVGYWRRCAAQKEDAIMIDPD